MNERPHYIDNAKLAAALLQYKSELLAAKAAGASKPILPDFVGECFLLLAQKLSRRGDFASYIFRDDMISDGVENAVLYVANWDEKRPEKTFAYFTQMMIYAFIRRIKKEKKHLATKYKQLFFQQLFHEKLLQEDGTMIIARCTTEDAERDMIEFVDNFDKSNAKKSKKMKKRKAQSALSELWDGDVN